MIILPKITLKLNEKYENSGIQLLLAPTVQRSISITVRDKGNLTQSILRIKLHQNWIKNKNHIYLLERKYPKLCYGPSIKTTLKLD